MTKFRNIYNLKQTIPVQIAATNHRKELESGHSEQSSSIAAPSAADAIAGEISGVPEPTHASIIISDPRSLSSNHSLSKPPRIQTATTADQANRRDELAEGP